MLNNSEQLNNNTSHKESSKEKVLAHALKKESHSFFGFFIKHFRFTYLILLVILAIGTFALLSLPREANPEVKVPIAVVTTVYPGATPSDTEELITNKIEEKIKNLDNLKQFNSTSGAGISSVIVEYIAEADLQESYQKLREAVDRAKPELPQDAEDPVVTEIRLNDFSIVTYSLVNGCQMQTLNDCATKLQQEMETIPGVSKVEVVGGLDREYQIILNRNKLSNYKVSIGQVVAAVSRSNLNLPAGDIEINNYNYNVRIKAKQTTINELKKTPVTVYGETPVLLQDVATLKDTFAEKNTESKIGFANQESSQTISLEVYKKTGGNIIEIVESTEQKIDELYNQGELPEGLQIIKTNDNSVYIKDSLNILSSSGLQTMVLILIFLLLVLGWRSAIITAFSVPIAFLMSFIWLYFQGETLNSMVLFALVLSLGLMVDNSIVVIEGIVEYLGPRYNYSSKQAAVLSVWNYKWPIIAGTMTTVSAFLPMLLVSGILGEYMGVLPKTLSATLISSLFVALIIIPTLAARKVKRSTYHDKPVSQQGRFNFVARIIEKIKPRYSHFMSSLLPSKKKRRRLIVASWILFFLAVSIPASGLMKVEMFPSIDMQFFQVAIELPAGSSLDKTKAVTLQVEKQVAQIPELDNYVTSVGRYSSFFGDSGSGEHLATVFVNLVEDDKRERESFQVAEDLRQELKNINGAEIRIEESNAGPPTGAPIEVRITGPQTDDLVSYGKQIENILKEIPGTVNITSSAKESSGEFVFYIDKQAVAYYGLDVPTVAAELRGALYGSTASTVSVNGEDIDIRVRYDSNEFNDINDLKNISLPTPRGQQVILSQLADIELEPALLNINHRDGERIITVTGNIKPGANLQKILQEFDQKKQELNILDDYQISVGGETEDIERSYQEMFLSMIVAVFLIASILVLQFNSFRQPLIIIFTVPLAIIGVIVGLNLLRLPFSLPAFIGVVSLAGIVVNDAIVLVDKANKNLKYGMSRVEAVLDAGKARMQPIFLTSITTVAGIFPLTFADELWKGLGWTVIFGLIFSTALTLVVVPTLFVSFSHKKAKEIQDS